MRLVGARGRGLRHRPLLRRDRRVRQLQHEHLPADQRPGRASRSGPVRQRLSGRLLRRPAGCAPRHAGHAHLLQAEPARAVDERAERLLVVAARGGAGLPEPAALPVGHGAGRRRLRHLPAEARLPASGRRHGIARRHLPPVRQRRRRHDVRRRRGDGGAQAPGRRHRRQRPCLCRDPRQRGQQRRQRQGGRDRAQRARAGRGHRLGAGRVRRRACIDRLCRVPRHGDAARRPDRVRGPGARLRRGRRRAADLRAGLGQGQHRPSRRRRGRDRPDQDRARPPSSRNSAAGELPQAEPAHRSGRDAVLLPHGGHGLAGGQHAAAGRGELLRRRRHQRACRARGSARPRGAPPGRTAPSCAAALRPQRSSPRRGGGGACRPSRPQQRDRARGCRPYAAGRPAGVRAPRRRRLCHARGGDRGPARAARTGGA